MTETLILLIAAHALCDYPLQGDFLSRGKNHTAPIPGIPWWQAMWAHSAIHAGAVQIITGIWLLSVAEFVIHFATDRAKCAGWISFNTDQAIHITCKLCWAVIAWMVAA